MRLPEVCDPVELAVEFETNVTFVGYVIRVETLLVQAQPMLDAVPVVTVAGVVVSVAPGAPTTVTVTVSVAVDPAALVQVRV